MRWHSNREHSQGWAMWMWESIPGWGTSKYKGPGVACAWGVWETAWRPAGWRGRGGTWESRSGVRTGHCKDLGINSAVGSLVWGSKVTRSGLCFKRITAATLGTARWWQDKGDIREPHCRNPGKKRQGILSGHFLPNHGGSWCDLLSCQQEADPPAGDHISTQLCLSLTATLRQREDGSAGAEEDTVYRRKRACNPGPFLLFLTDRRMMDGWIMNALLFTPPLVFIYQQFTKSNDKECLQSSGFSIWTRSSFEYPLTLTQTSMVHKLLFFIKLTPNTQWTNLI